MKLKTILVAAIVIIAIIFAYTRITTTHSDKSAAPPASSTTFNLKKYSIDDPTSQWIVVNKKRPLHPLSYAPANLVVPHVPLQSPGSISMQLDSRAASALEALVTAGQNAGIKLELYSGYRSYEQQVSTYNSEVRGFGQVQADKESARPGYSEHQTGLAADISAVSGTCDLQVCFGTTEEGKWLATNAYKYGFIVSYPQDKIEITGFMYEPWHIRYVGKELASEMHKTGIKTLNEMFKLPASTDY
jgi:D-alanyl-D-alanine carboxypeptidase